VTGRQGRRRRKLLDDLKEKRVYSCEGGSSDRTMWRARFRRGFGPVLRHTAKQINESHTEKETGHNKPAPLDILNGMHKNTC
jgi:hypothetical protein